MNARLENRVEKSVGKLKIVKERKSEWERVNRAVEGKDIKGAKKEAKEIDLDDLGGDGDGIVNGDGEMIDVVEGVDGMRSIGENEVLSLPVLASRPPAEIPLPIDEEDEVL